MEQKEVFEKNRYGVLKVSTYPLEVANIPNENPETSIEVGNDWYVDVEQLFKEFVARKPFMTYKKEWTEEVRTVLSHEWTPFCKDHGCGIATNRAGTDKAWISQRRLMQLRTTSSQ